MTIESKNTDPMSLLREACCKRNFQMPEISTVESNKSGKRKFVGKAVWPALGGVVTAGSGEFDTKKSSKVGSS